VLQTHAFCLLRATPLAYLCQQFILTTQALLLKSDRLSCWQDHHIE